MKPNPDGYRRVIRALRLATWCSHGWGPGCDSYTGGHLCTREPGHRGKCRCACGARTVRPADGGVTREPRDNL